MGKKLGDYARRAPSTARCGKTEYETARRVPLVARRAYGDTNREIAQSLMRGAHITGSWVRAQHIDYRAPHASGLLE